MIRLLVLLLLIAAPAQAHLLKLFVAAEGTVITGSAYFAGGGPASKLTGAVRAADGTEIGQFTTGNDGRFIFQATSRTDHLFVLDGGDGHVARALIGADILAHGLPQGPGGQASLVHPGGPTAADLDALEAAVARQIIPLRRQLDAYESRLRLHDLLGGIGIIFGLFGTFAWISTRRRTP